VPWNFIFAAVSVECNKMCVSMSHICINNNNNNNNNNINNNNNKDFY